MVILYNYPLARHLALVLDRFYSFGRPSHGGNVNRGWGRLDIQHEAIVGTKKMAPVDDLAKKAWFRM